MEQLVLITMSVKEFRNIINEEVKRALENQIETQERIKQLPPFLTREEFMEVLHISSTTATAIMGRSDFKVFRQGKILIETEFLFKWIDEHSDWNKTYRARKGGE